MLNVSLEKLRLVSDQLGQIQTQTMERVVPPPKLYNSIAQTPWISLVVLLSFPYE